MQISLPNAEVALMTACESATGDIKLSDEAMHLAGGMIYAGFHGVVATMYLFSASPDATDSHGGANNDQIREQTYSERAAEALHHTVKQMRDSGVPPYRWVPFVHMGR
ncbi:hypothetical protein AcW1_006558 [Taiwanofungus camphoratus]|nr:hypothetical protein AcW1_006558 [Antrodia cinnamomea]